MENSLLKKRAEKPKVKVQVKPLTMCKVFFKEGYVLNSSKVLETPKPDFIIGKDLTFIEEKDLIHARFINKATGIGNTWTVYRNGEYAKIIKTK
jgi:hypothetical protein